MVRTHKKKTIINELNKQSVELQWYMLFPNKNIVQVSEPFDGTIEESIWRRLFWQDVGKSFKREPTISKVLRLLLNSY